MCYDVPTTVRGKARFIAAQRFAPGLSLTTCLRTNAVSAPVSVATVVSGNVAGGGGSSAHEPALSAKNGAYRCARQGRCREPGAVGFVVWFEGAAAVVHTGLKGSGKSVRACAVKGTKSKGTVSYVVLHRLQGKVRNTTLYHPISSHSWGRAASSHIPHSPQDLP
jgi:hypothetical protein